MGHCYKYGVSLMEYLDKKLTKRATVRSFDECVCK